MLAHSRVHAQLAILYQLGPPALETVLPTAGWACLHQFRQSLIGMSTGQPDKDSSSAEILAGDSQLGHVNG